MAKYPTEVFWSDEDKGYIAVVPDLLGCNACGNTEADAIRRAHRFEWHRIDPVRSM